MHPSRLSPLVALAVGLADPIWARTDPPFDAARSNRARVLAAAARYLGDAPITVTAAVSPRSAGGPHDFFSEGDYWWPDPKNPDGPYVQRDGMTNPDNFVEHRRALMRLSVQVPTLAAAWRLTGDAFLMPHALRTRTYHSSALFLWQHPRPPMHYDNPQFEEFYNGWERENYQNTWSDVWRVSLEKVDRLGSTFFWWGALLLLPGLPFGLAAVPVAAAGSPLGSRTTPEGPEPLYSLK